MTKLTAAQSETLMQQEPFFAKVRESLPPATAQALDKLTSDIGTYYAAGTWTGGTTGTQTSIPLPAGAEEPTLERTQAVMAATQAALTGNQPMQEQLSAIFDKAELFPQPKEEKPVVELGIPKLNVGFCTIKNVAIGALAAAGALFAIKTGTRSWAEKAAKLPVFDGKFVKHTAIAAAVGGGIAAPLGYCKAVEHNRTADAQPKR